MPAGLVPGPLQLLYEIHMHCVDVLLPLTLDLALAITTVNNIVNQHTSPGFDLVGSELRWHHGGGGGFETGFAANPHAAKHANMVC
jgi:hypothetical protein